MARLDWYLVVIYGCVAASVDSKEMFGCVLPPEPIFGRFVFNEQGRSYHIQCDDGYMSTAGYFGRERWCRKKYRTWTGKESDCILSRSVRLQCPGLRNPRNGEVQELGRTEHSQGYFSCNAGYVLEGPDEVTCLSTFMWSGIPPVCSSRKTAADLALALRRSFVDKYASSTIDSETGHAESRLAAGKSGLDLIIAMDTSSSIGDHALEIAKGFSKIIVEKFGISSDRLGGGNGTRIALLTFTSKAELLFNLDDPLVRSKEAAKAKIDTITTSGGGTDFRQVLDTITSRVFMPKMNRGRSSMETSRALFIITDAEQTVSVANGEDMSREELMKSIREKTNILKHFRMEIFTLGVGKIVDKFALANLATSDKHVFIINKIADLEKITDVIAEKNIDYSECGISGNVEIHKGTHGANKGAWPWAGWLSVEEKTCGGTLISDRWFLTTATCVSRVDKTGHVTPYPADTINVYLGDYHLYGLDNEEQSAVVEYVHLHGNYTGLVNSHQIREFDVALLDLGRDNSTRPELNKFVKPICAAQGLMKANSALLLQELKDTPLISQGFTTGWGHAPDNIRRQFCPWYKCKQSNEFLWNYLVQNERAVQTDKVCNRVYDALDIKKYFCVGNQISESESCRGDIGGAYMAETPEVHKFVALGLALKTDNCKAKSPHHFCIFLDLTHESISDWLNHTMENADMVKEEVVELERDDGRNDTEAHGGNEEENALNHAMENADMDKIEDLVELERDDGRNDAEAHGGNEAEHLN